MHIFSIGSEPKSETPQEVSIVKSHEFQTSTQHLKKASSTNIEILHTASYKIEYTSDLSSLTHWNFLSEEIIVAFSANTVCVFNLITCDNDQDTFFRETTYASLPAFWGASSRLTDQNLIEIILMESSSSNVMVYSSVDSFSVPFEYSFCAENGNVSSQFSLKKQLGMLDNVLGSNVTSIFNEHPEFLLYIDNDHHKLVCIKWDEFEDKSNNKNRSSIVETKTNMYKRSVEQGCEIVHLTNKGGVILQMPRGNLELIHPKPLVLTEIYAVLEDHERGWSASVIENLVVEMRRLRFNLNLLIDHDLKRFLDKLAPILIKSISDNKKLCQFIADISCEDCTRTTYANFYAATLHPRASQMVQSDKVSIVCNRLLELMVCNPTRYALPMISCHVRLGEEEQKKEDVGAEVDRQFPASSALGCIQEWRKDKRNSSLVSDALLFLLVLFDDDGSRLFKTALSLYDLDLASFVGKNSKDMDPKEYLPFLLELKSSDDLNLMKYKIDSHLKRWRRCVDVMTQISTFIADYEDEFLSIVKRERLFKEAVQAISKHVSVQDENHELLKKVYNLHGEYLESKKYFEDAAYKYEQSENITQAIVCLEKEPVLSWRRALLLTNFDQDVCLRFLAALERENRMVECAEICSKYFNKNSRDGQDRSIQMEIEYLIKGKRWFEVTSAVEYNFKEQQIIHDNMMKDIHLKSKLHAASLLSTVQSLRVKFETQLFRLHHVVNEREASMELEFNAREAGEEQNDDSDMFSDTESTFSGVSSILSRRSVTSSLATRASTATSSRQRRKESRKAYSTREGGPFEDLGLIVSLHEVITSTYDLVDETSTLTRFLFTRRSQCNGEDVMKQKASELQSTLSSFLDFIDASLKSIWIESPSNILEQNVARGMTDNTFQLYNNEKRYVPQMHKLDHHLRYPPVKKFNQRSWKLHLLES